MFYCPVNWLASAMAERAGLRAEAQREGTARAFERNIFTVAESVRLRRRRVHQILRDVAEDEGYLLVDLVAAIVAGGDEALGRFVDRVHRTTRERAGRPASWSGK